MKPIFIDLHIHTSENPDDLNQSYDLDILKEKIEKEAEDSSYLISLTDHNTINKPVYLKAVEMFENILLGVELHVRNHDFKKPYHCHIYFNLEQINTTSIDDINAILNELYPKKVVADDDKIPRLEEIMNGFDSYEFVLLPHGGQSHSTFNESIPKGVKLDNTLERNIYYNHFDGFTARSNTGLERTQEYFKRLEINEFVNLVTASDNYSPQSYPKAKASDAPPFVKTWMMALPTFNGLRLSLSESSRLKYGKKPDSWAEYIEHVSLKNDNIDIDVDLTPGLNVVIGGSSSGKTLFVDSLYRKIINDFEGSNYTAYGVEEIHVMNQTGQKPYYLEQTYISKVCDYKDKENNIEDISVLKRVFPDDVEESKGIASGLSDLNSHLSLLVQSVKEMESIQDVLATIPILSRLIVTEEIQDNPLKYILPTEKVIDSIRYSKISYENDVKNLDKIEKFLSENPLINHDNILVEKLKKELKLAFDHSKMESSIRETINVYKKEIDDAKKAEKLEVTTKARQFDELLKCVRKYFKFNKQFYKSLDLISKFALKIPTKKVESMGHTLFIQNEFNLTKDKFLEVVNIMLKTKYKLKKFNDITPESLFKTKLSERGPKVDGYDGFKNKVNSEFVSMNKKKYNIITNEGKEFDKLSAGWKTSVILDLILGCDTDNAPLIIDQPEDNLATGYINFGLLKAIKECKYRKQIILVSHNATIPMLGDAQNVVMCKNEDKVITIRSNPLEGSIGDKDVVDLIAETTDGGKISIKKRVKKYNLKKFRSSDEANIQKR
ncbi:MAG: ATPase [Planctomycetes bacterium GWF2_41_51]|nr:MAG: ATPase [Planctomycetes bacterium GWF2_41_51]HBG27640.1 ATPase [Phycisphaerales bacterium]